MPKVFLYIDLFITGLLISVSGALAATAADADSDGLADDEEATIYATDPKLADTDGDSYSDKQEIEHGYSPRFFDKKLTEVDSDKDYLPDAWEIALGTGIMEPNSDGDGYLDGTEVRAGYDPLNTDPNAKLEKMIRVDLGKQHLTYSFGSKTLESFLISSGLPGTPTPRGEFEVITKRDLVNYRGSNYNYPNTKWNLRFAWGNEFSYYIHGTWWHDNFGKPMSHGCVNVSYEHMERLYEWAQVGTKIIIN